MLGSLTLAVCSFFIGVSSTIGELSLNETPQDDEGIQKMLKQMLHNYDRRVRPNYLGPAVDVDVEASVLTISKIDEVNMMYTIDMFFRQRWNDHRLKHNLGENLTLIVGTKHPSDFIWVPDTVFIDSVKSNMHGVTVNNHKIDIGPNGDVLWGTRVTVSPTCNFDLRRYPMDKQKCHFVILSYAYTSRHLKYRWINRGLIVYDIKMAQFILSSHENISTEVSYAAGDYTQLVGIFYLDRQLGHAIMQIYVPSVCVVLVAYLSLYVPRTSVPARVGLCITTLLTISSFWSSVNARLPRVNYVKAIDIFMLTSFTTVILTLVQFILVHNSASILNVLKSFHMKKKKMSLMKGEGSEKHPTRGAMGYYKNNPVRFATRTSPSRFLTVNELMDFDPTEDCHESGHIDELLHDENESRKEENEKLAQKIEGYARIFFPISYASFLLIYFMIYLNQDYDLQEKQY